MFYYLLKTREGSNQVFFSREKQPYSAQRFGHSTKHLARIKAEAYKYPTEASARSVLNRIGWTKDKVHVVSESDLEAFAAKYMPKNKDLQDVPVWLKQMFD